MTRGRDRSRCGATAGVVCALGACVLVTCDGDRSSATTADGRPIGLTPDTTGPWRGVVLVRQFRERIDSFAIDGRVPDAATAWPVEGEGFVFDTTRVPDGTHRLELRGPYMAPEQFDVVTDNGGVDLAPSFTGRLVDVSARAFTERLPSHHVTDHDYQRAVAADVDRDGAMDLFVWDAHSFGLYRQTAPGVFSPGTLPLGLQGSVQGAGFGDLDGDGYDDLVLGSESVTVLHNDGHGSFTDVSATAFDTQPRGVSYYGVTFADLDADGLLDFAMGDMSCAGGTSIVMHNEGGLHFANVAPEMHLEARGEATFGYVIDRPGADSVLTLVNMREGCIDARSVLRRTDPSGAFLQILTSVTTTESNLQAMGSAWVDLNGDGVLDLVYANGDVNRAYAGPTDFDTDLAAHAGLALAATHPGIARASPWNMVALDADLDGRTDLVVVGDGMPNDSTGLLSHALYWQWGNGKFRDVGMKVGLVTQAPCSPASGADLDGDGDTDLLVGCGDGLRVLRNDLVDPTDARAIDLRGGISNTDGVHAILRGPTGEVRLQRGGGQPYAGGVSRESMALGAAGELEVQWQSGITQRVPAGGSRRLEVHEPVAVTLSSRRLTANDPQDVTLEVRTEPSVLPGDVTVRASTGTWTRPIARDATDGRWRGVWQAPAASTDARFTVTVGTTELRVRPTVYVRP